MSSLELAPKFIPELREVVKRARKDPEDSPIWIVGKSSSLRYSSTFDSVLDQRDAVSVSEFKHRGCLMGLATAFTHDVYNLLVRRTEKPNDLLRKLVEQKQASQASVFVLDLMSYGAVLRDLGVEGIAVALSDKRNEKEKAKDVELGVNFIQGDLRSAKSWRSVSKWLESKGDNAKFDIVLCHPVGALDDLPHDPAYYTYFFKKVYSMLSNNGGIFLSQFSGDMKEEVIMATEEINVVEGIEARANISKNPTFALKKNLDSPDFLKLQNS